MEISIIVPCRNEGSNVETLTNHIIHHMHEAGFNDYEIMFVDDSNDDTPARLEKLTETNHIVHYIHRSASERTGLSTAIIEGFHQAKGNWFIVMDADLQHPPEKLPDLVDAIHQSGSDIIIPSRFIPGGDDGGLSTFRKFVSWTARTMAKLSLRRIMPITDPTGGFFAVRRQTAFSKPLDPIGWKILLEILVRSEYKHVSEIPYEFKPRGLGSSKLNIKEQWNFFRHLGRLIKSSEQDLLFWKYCTVGLSGVVVNMAVYIGLIHLHLSVNQAFAAATSAAMVYNFIFHDKFTWSHVKKDSLLYRLIKFVLVSLSGLGISSGTVSLFHHFLGSHYLIAGFIGIIVSTGWNFILNHLWTFTHKKAPSSSRSL